MRGVRNLGFVGVLGVVGSLLTAHSSTALASELALLADDTSEISLHIEYPETGSAVSDFGCGCFVAGRAFRGGFDIAIVLDTSGSTAEPSGADINRNGVIGSRRGVGMNWLPGARSSDTGDTVLAAEVAAAERLLDDLDPRITRVAVISFSGGFEPGSSYFARGRGDRPAAMTHVPLTNDFRRVKTALSALRLAGSDGGTDMAAGVRRGFVELHGLRGARSTANEQTTKLMFFFTDGEPTEPFGPRARGKNFVAVLDEARRAHRLGVRVHTFAIGDTAVSLPIAAVQLADMTGGEFTPVVNPGELSAVLETLQFANLKEVAIRSRPKGLVANLVHIAADGSWGGFVKLAAGTNRIEVAARSGDGSTVTEHVDVVGNHSETPATIPNGLNDRFKRLQRDCLHQLRGDRIMAEAAADQHDLKKLRLEIDRERARARKRADEQRKSLRLEVEPEDADRFDPR